MRRSVVGVDIPGTLLQIRDLRTATTPVRPVVGKRIVESTFRIVPTPNLWRQWQRGAKRRGRVPGGTLPTAGG